MKDRGYDILGILLMCIVWLSFHVHASPINEEALQNLLNRGIILPTGEIIKLRDIYGNDINIHNFDPGPGMLQVLTQLPPDSIPAITLTYIKDLPEVQKTDILFEYIKKAIKTVSKNNFVLIKGSPLIGKTRALRIIEYELLTQSKPDLAIYVDLTQMLNSDAVFISNSNDLLERSMPKDVANFIKNVADVNPSKVRILMDNIDKISLAHQQQLFDAISELHSRGIRTVISSTINIERAFSQWQMKPAVFDIPELSEMDFETLANKHWIQKLGDTFVELHEKRIRQYAKALRIMVFETPLPRFIIHLQHLLDIVTTNLMSPFPSLKDYIQYPEQYHDPKSILKSFDYLHFNKVKYYAKIMSKFELPAPLGPEVEITYGIQAMKMLLDPAATPLIYRETRNAISWSENKIAERGPNMYILMIFEDGIPVDFVHPEYKHYYAAMYILGSFNTPTPLIETFKTIILDPKYIMLVELINFNIQSVSYYDTLIETIFSNEISKVRPAVLAQMADNLISHRLDTLLSKVLKTLHQVKRLALYMHLTGVLESKNKYSLGILSETRNVNKYYHIPRKTPWMYKGTRIEMILNLKLARSLYTLMIYGYRVDPNLELISAAKVSHGMAAVLDSHRGHNFPVEVLNKAVYESIKALGPDAIDNMRTLIARGAQPTAISVEGRTLAHEAARWHSRQLLETVHKEFGVPLSDTADKGGITVLFELLDHALPSNVYLQENTWESISYLAEHGNLQINEKIIADALYAFTSYAPPLDRVAPAIQSIISYDLKNFGSTKDLINTLREFIPVEGVDVPRETLSIRRLLITKNCIKQMLEQHSYLGVVDYVTVAELVLSHKAMSGHFQFHHYQNAMKYLLIRKLMSFYSSQLERISHIVVKSMYIATDFIKVTEMIRKNVIEFEPDILESFKTAYYQRIEKKNSPAHIGDDFETRTVKTVDNLHPDIKYNIAWGEAAVIEENLHFASDYTTRDDVDANNYPCNI